MDDHRERFEILVQECWAIRAAWTEVLLICQNRWTLDHLAQCRELAHASMRRCGEMDALIRDTRRRRPIIPLASRS